MQKNLIQMNLVARSDVPGYLGFVPGHKAENIYGVTFANVVKTSKDWIKSAEDIPPELRFLTVSQDTAHRIQHNIAKDETPQSKFWHNGENISLLQTKKQEHREEKRRERQTLVRPEKKCELTLQEAYSRY